MKNTELGKKFVTVFLTSGAIFVFLVLLVFGVQQKKLNQEFDSLISNNLESYTKNQQRQLDSRITDVLKTMSAVSAMMETNSLSPEQDWFDSFLEKLGQKNKGDNLEYISIDVLWEQIEKGECWFKESEIYWQLLMGSSSISDDFKVRKDGKSYFAVGYPVSRDGKVIGILQTEIPATVLTSVNQESHMYEKVSTCILVNSGDIAFSRLKDFQKGNNLFSILEKQGISSGHEEKVRKILDDDKDVNKKIPLKNDTYYASVTKLDYNGWYIFNLVSEDDVLVNSNSIFHNMLLSGIILILLTAIMLAGGYLFIRCQQREMELDEKRFAALLQFSDTVLFEYFVEKDVLQFSRNAVEMLNLEQYSFENFSTGIAEEGLIHPDDVALVYQNLQEIPGKKETCRMQLRIRGRDEGYRWYSCQMKPLFSRTGKADVVAGKLEDITEMKYREEKLLEISKMDALTGAYNKSGVEEIDIALEKNPKGILFMIDLDNFKGINDNWGHAVGDKVLREVGTVLKGIFRGNDLVVRVGGDEFAVFLIGSSDSTLAEQKADAIMQGLGGIHVEGCEKKISASIGIAISPNNGSTFARLYRAADNAMYRIKKEEKNGYALSR